MNYFTKRRILQLFFPNRCPICGEFIGCNDTFCTDCSEKITVYNGSFSIENAESFTAAYVYNDSISSAVFLMKDGICGNADYALANGLAAALKENGISKSADIIIPVPLHPSSLRKRGFNQSELIGKELERILNIELVTDATEKVHSTSEQKTLSREQRMVNLKNSFAVTKPEKIQNKRVLLVDDVCTTGSTLSEIAGILLKSGAKTVHCAACCKTE